jgi:hypothetical protein
MALNVGDRLTLRATVAERVHLGGDHNVCLEADGMRFWVTESKLAAFVAAGEHATGLALDETDLSPAPAAPTLKSPARKR